MRNGGDPLKQKVDTMMLFTLSACPMGRSMGTVLQEVKKRFDSIKVQVVYVDVDIDKTNHYRIKKNPTTLFLDREGNELYRLEGFKETDEVIDLLELLNKGAIQEHESLDENMETVEAYTIYLYQKGQLVPVKVNVLNRTSVKAPRIKAIQQLMKTKKEKYENPFPDSATLKLVRFDHHFAEITIQLPQSSEFYSKQKMKQALLKTLEPFGVTEVNLKLIFSEKWS